LISEEIKCLEYIGNGSFSFDSNYSSAEIDCEPRGDLVLCRDQHGNPTAVYDWDVWDFNPYRLGVKKINKISFCKVFESDGPEQRSLISEIKYSLYCLIYYSGSGRLGKLGPATAVRYWRTLVSILRFCYLQKQKPAVGVLSLRQILTTPIYMAAFIASLNGHQSAQARVSQLLLNLIHIGEKRLGYRVLSAADLRVSNVAYKQHPVIPTRIYLELINTLSDLLNQVYQGVGVLEAFIAEFRDEFYGIHYVRQKSLGVGGKACYRPSMVDAIEIHGLRNVFVGDFACAHKKLLSGALLRIQSMVKHVLQLYTGMREDEVMRMSYDCLINEVFGVDLIDDRGFTQDEARSVNILSTTSKFSGYRKSVSWLAPNEVIRAIEVAQSICRGLAKHYGLEKENCPLFLNPAILSYRKTEVGVGRVSGNKVKLESIQMHVIQSSDLQELSQTDTRRDFYNESKFSVGRPWPLTSHQFRRSLAFYASNSGFVSLPTLKSQYKHMTIEMSRYYSNGFENLKTIFGYYDSSKKEYLLPDSHVALEFQMGMPMAIANQLVSDVLFKENPLFGGTGSYLEKQKLRIESGEISIEYFRAETAARVKNGEMSYRSTLLGGCTKFGRCDSFLLGDYTECLSCEGAIIKKDKISEAIYEAESELRKYFAGTAEHQITEGEIKRLKSFQKRLICRGLSDE